MNDYIEELADFFEAFSIFIETMKNSTKNDLLERDPFYNELIEKLKKKESIVENLLDKLSDECKKTIIDYIIDLKDIHYYEGDYFYMKGYSDCIRLFHRLDVLK